MCGGGGNNGGNIKLANIHVHVLTMYLKLYKYMYMYICWQLPIVSYGSGGWVIIGRVAYERVHRPTK